MYSNWFQPSPDSMPVTGIKDDLSSDYHRIVAGIPKLDALIVSLVLQSYEAMTLHIL